MCQDPNESEEIPPNWYDDNSASSDGATVGQDSKNDNQHVPNHAGGLTPLASPDVQDPVTGTKLGR